VSFRVRAHRVGSGPHRAGSGPTGPSWAHRASIVNGLGFGFEKLVLGFLWTFENHVGFKIYLGPQNKEYELGPNKIKS
jgi:hypothetical protein